MYEFVRKASLLKLTNAVCFLFSKNASLSAPAPNGICNLMTFFVLCKKFFRFLKNYFLSSLFFCLRLSIALRHLSVTRACKVNSFFRSVQVFFFVSENFFSLLLCCYSVFNLSVRLPNRAYKINSLFCSVQEVFSIFEK